VPPPGKGGGYTLLERHWPCVQHHLFSCTASPCSCTDPNDLWADLWDLLPPDAPARELVRLALYVDSFDADAVRTHCKPWPLAPGSRQGALAPFLLPANRLVRKSISIYRPISYRIGLSTDIDMIFFGHRLSSSEPIYCNSDNRRVTTYTRHYML
jgi:hypothetical protein